MVSINNGLKPGALLRHNSYRIERILGQGGFGITYLATDLPLERFVAIKEFFPKDYCERESTTSHITIGTSSNVDLISRLKAKFLKEARNIAKLDHPGIIKIHSAFEENNTAYYVMEYIEGRNLSEMVKQTGSLSESKAIQYISKVGDTLDYIHKQNINHLDIKPANIMIRKSDDRPALIDFGLAKQYDAEGNQTSTTPTGISHGFAPLEQYKVGGVSEFSPQTDVYSLAATLFYLISGIVPPHATDLIENDLTFPHTFPLSLQPPIRKAMSTKRQNRPESVQEFLNSLESTDIEIENTILAVPVEKKETHFSRKEQSSKDSYAGNKEPGKAKNKKIARVKPSTQKSPRKRYNFHAYYRKNSSKFHIGLVSLILIAGITASGFIIFKDQIQHASFDTPEVISEDPLAIYDEIEEVVSHYVENLAFKSSLGLCSYTGEVDENNLPNGHGVATWDSGDAKSYDGEWVHGVMEGQTTYTLNNGDTFVGIFKDNHYAQGRYTIKADGYYFEGTFKNGQPDKGSWYDKSGKNL